MSGISMGDNFLDHAAFFNALSKICVCLAVAFWLFACVRLFKRNADRQATDQLAVIAFALQLIVPVAATLLLPHRLKGPPDAVLFVIEASLSVMTIIWASGSKSMIGSRIKTALLLWISAFIFAISSPSMTP
jgi:hypothetical protein